MASSQLLLQLITFSLYARTPRSLQISLLPPWLLLFSFLCVLVPPFLPSLLTREYPRAQSLDLPFMYTAHSFSDLTWSHRYTSLSISLFSSQGPPCALCGHTAGVWFQEEAEDYETTATGAAEETRRFCFLNFEGFIDRPKAGFLEAKSRMAPIFWPEQLARERCH